jgi:hypothetical protein
MRFIGVVLLCLFVFQSCQKRLKTVDEYHPDIELISATALASGAVEVVCKIHRDGVAPYQSSGFGFSENAEFSISENQVRVPVNGDMITYTYPPEMFSEQTTYYFKCFVVTRYGLKISNVLSISNIEIVPVEAPCNHPENKYRFFSNPPYYDIIPGNTVSLGTLSAIYRSSIMPNGVLEVRFRNPPITGIYTIASSNDLDHFEARVVIMGASPSSAKVGGLIYVNKISDTQFRIQSCSLPWMLTTSNETTFDMNWLLNY